MADVLLNLVEQTPVAGIAVGGALVAAAVGYGAVKAIGGGSSKPEPVEVAKKTKTAKKKTKKAKTAEEPAKENEAEKINLEDFVVDYPDTEEEEAARAEKKKQKRKQKKKNAKEKAKAAASAPTSAVSDSDNAKAKAAAAVAAAKKDAEDGWSTVATKKKTTKVKTN
ncbi:hypothetical protein Poli38472_009848 [Pythium oligandrum]|uniref:Uncharacterized protein n=1 Tax=Pythium oligandrum TaxID=41045 RepID=A0A8K1FG41_PYTOL|nr:hypothetical protein Poli38472_009848 [Pythium oligandrum]|eukprot:TMW62355.1 hypothetical protein Poli38472_009848 [Pythium oligandrum]